MENLNLFDKIIKKIAKIRGLDCEDELSLLKSIINALPDMLWAKGPDGCYLYANKSVIDNLLFSKTLENTINRKDYEMAKARKKVIGDENHTFGEVCGNSDYVVLDKEESERFLEYGKICGTDVYLEVNKNILKDEEGNIIGTVGTGRNITREYHDLSYIKDNIDTLTKDQIKNKLDEVMNRYIYTSSDT